MLNTKNVYILDCTADIFLWTGKKANRLLKMAGQKLVTELHQMIDRPDYAQISRETEVQNLLFKDKILKILLKDNNFFNQKRVISYGKFRSL